MSDETRTMDLYLIQSPDVTWDNGHGEKDYTRDLLRYYRNSIPIRDVWDFVGRITFEVAAQRRLIKNLVIGSHGSGNPQTRSGIFMIGRTYMTATVENDSDKEAFGALSRA